MKPLEMENGQLSYEIKSVVFDGKKYPAPINIFPLLVVKTITNVLKQPKQ
jgi:hypothetical protein